MMIQNGEKSHEKTHSALEMAHIALGAILIAICSWINIPAVVPFTLQTFAVFAILSILGGRKGTWAILLYLLLGAIGLPVFAGFRAGPGAILGATGGYIVGFLFIGCSCQAVTKVFGRKLWAEIMSMALGLAVCYAFGTAWFMVVYMHGGNVISLGAALMLCVVPFIVPDLIKMGLAILLARRIRR